MLRYFIPCPSIVDTPDFFPLTTDLKIQAPGIRQHPKLHAANTLDGALASKRRYEGQKKIYLLLQVYSFAIINLVKPLRAKSLQFFQVN